jgi:hypothetical protein
MTPTEAKGKGFRVLAGPFDADSPQDEDLRWVISAFIEKSGGRILVVETQSKPTVRYLYRHGLEMETIKQTERRLKMAKLRK